MSFMDDKIQSNPVVLFDGVCNFCNSSINFIIKWDKEKKIRFAALQGETGMQLKQKYFIPENVDSIIFIENNQAFIYSTAALKICKHLRFPVSLFLIVALIPKLIRDPFYKWFANNRYKWFGKKETCMIPPKEVKMRFLD
jgi:predicted DCC family thiol-disulfide oxidoreductase YuxK